MLTKNQCKEIILKYGNHIYESYELKFKNRIYNEWNCWVKGMYIYKDHVGFDIYYQSGNTDHDERVRFDELFVRFGWSSEQKEAIFKELLSFKK